MAIKSSFDLAMERLAKQSPQPAKKLSAAQKTKLAEVDKLYTAKIAEMEIQRSQKIAEVRARGDHEGATKLEEEMRAEIQKLRRDLERKKESVRQSE